MYGQSLYGGLYGENITIISLSSGSAIIFNDYSLQSAIVTTSKITVDDFPEVEYSDFSVPRSDGLGFLSKFYRSRRIEVSGVIRGSTEDELQSNIDEFKGKIALSNGTFKYLSKGVYRSITATAVSVKIPKEHYHITIAPFSIEFKTTDSFFYESTTGIIDNTTYSPYTIQIVNTGSAESLPISYITFSGTTGVGNVSLLLGGVTISYSGAISNGDILVFDSQNLEVKKNGATVEYSGTFQKLSVGVNSLVFTIDGTFTADFSIIYRKNYL